MRGTTKPYFVVFQEFSLLTDGQWLTTGQRESMRVGSRAEVEAIVAQRGGPGIQFWASGEGQEGSSDVGSRKIDSVSKTVLEEYSTAIGAGAVH